MSSQGYSEEMATSDSARFGGLIITSSAGIDMGGFRVTNLGAPVSASDAATKTYVDALTTGLDFKNSVRVKTATALPAYTAAGSGVGKTLTANANGALTVDGVAVAVGNRVLVADQGASHVDHGIYDVTAAGSAGSAFVLTRSTDADSNAEVTAGMFTFVSEGTVWADTGWVLQTDDPVTVDTTTLSFSQFTGTGAVSAGAGLLKTGNVLDVEVDTAAAAQTAGSGGGSSGLEFDASGVGGKLRAAVNATAGLERTASGLGARLNGTTLQSAAAGLSVKGLPSLFEINGVATSANATATNVNSLLDGNPITGLHFHRDQKTDVPVDEAVAVADPLVAGTTNDRVQKGRADTDAKSYVLGVAETAQASVGSSTRMVLRGVASGVLSGATVGARYYLGATGGLTAANTPPGAGMRVILVGVAKSPTDLWTNIIDYGKKAA
jgi:hypothetical protein